MSLSSNSRYEMKTERYFDYSFESYDDNIYSEKVKYSKRQNMNIISFY